MGRPSHRRPRARRDARGVPRRGSRTSSACSRSAPEVVAHDLHPDYLSTALRARARRRRARRRSAPPRPPGRVPGRARPARVRAVGAIFDGTGYGDRRHRLGRRAPGRRPGRRSSAPAHAAAGADARRRRQAIREPWRMAFAWLAEAFGEPAAVAAGLRRLVERAALGAMAQVAASAGGLAGDHEHRAGCSTRSAALCGLRAEVTYEGQAAVELEAAACGAGTRAAATRSRSAGRPRGARSASRGPGDLRPISRAGVGRGDRRGALPRARRGRDGRGVHADRGRARARHASSSAAACSRTGCCSRRRRGGWTRAGLRVLIPERLPPNDGGISYGQAAVAAARSRADAPVRGRPTG